MHACHLYQNVLRVEERSAFQLKWTIICVWGLYLGGAIEKDVSHVSSGVKKFEGIEVNVGDKIHIDRVHLDST